MPFRIGPDTELEPPFNFGFGSGYKKKAGLGYATVSKKIQNANFSGVSNVLLSELDAKL